MTNASGITSIAPSAPTASAAPAPTPSSASAPSTATTIAQKLTASSQNFSISPRIVDDPSAGLIVQYLDSTGAVQSQIPSTRVVAYLRAGLTADGLSKSTSNQSNSTVA